MNLTDLQVELRTIEEQIGRLHIEIEKMKPQPEEEKKAAFEEITTLAKKQVIDSLRIALEDETLRKQFVSGLSYLLLTQETDIYERLLYLCRLSQGCGLEWSAEEIYKAGMEFEYKDLKDLCADLQEHKYSFLAEVFIIINLSEEASEETFTLAADMAKLMECDEEEVRVIAQVAKSRLTGNPELLKEIPKPSQNRWSGKFSGYISEAWLAGQRKRCDVICIEKNTRNYTKGIGVTLKAWETGIADNFECIVEYPCKVQDRLPSGSIVQLGDVLLTYEEEDKEETANNWFLSGLMVDDGHVDDKKPKKKSICAPCDGVCFFVEDERIGYVPDKKDKYWAVYVVSYFDEYDKFCKWYAEQNK